MYLGFNDAKKINECLNFLERIGCLDLQIFGDGSRDTIFRLEAVAEGLPTSEIEQNIDVILHATSGVESAIERWRGDDDNELLDEFANREHYGSMFHFDFTTHVVRYAYFDAGYTLRRNTDRHVWGMNDGKLFEELFPKFAFDADDLNQTDFFLDTRTWPLSDIEWLASFSTEFDPAAPKPQNTLPYLFDASKLLYTYCHTKGGVNPRIRDMVASIDKFVGPKKYETDETKSLHHVYIDYVNKSLSYERRYYAPWSKEFKSGSLDFEHLADLADRVTRESAISRLS